MEGSVTICSPNHLFDHFKTLVEDAVQNQNLSTSDRSVVYLTELLLEFFHIESLNGADEDLHADMPLAMMLSQALEAKMFRRMAILKRMGDIALYKSGFFGDSFNRKLVDVDYYISMGGSAYGQLSELTHHAYRDKEFSGVYRELSDKFSAFVDIFSEISERSHISSNESVLRLYDKWLKTKSKRLEEKLKSQGLIPNHSLNAKTVH